MADQPDPIVIKELLGTPPLTAQLADDDLPAGRRHEVAAFQSGGKWTIADDGIYNPGATRVVLQVMSKKYHPMVLKGAFRDAFYGVGHARAQRDLFERISDRVNPIEITWGDQVRQGILWETSFGEESASDITYELTFFIAVPQQGTQTQVRAAEGTTDPADLVATMKAQADLLQAELDNVALQASIQSNIAVGWETAQVALDNALLAVTIVNNLPASNAQQAISAARRVQTSVQSAQGQLVSLKQIYDSLSVDQLRPIASTKTADAEMALMLAVMNGSVGCLQLMDSLRSVAVIATLAIQQTTQVYRVQQGDTLESIARAKLGSRARAMDLGIPQSALVPGNLIRIPDAA